MNLLVDGHNLIGQMPGISLADPDDEAKLVMLLRRYASTRRGRQVIVVFDHGVYGHPQNLDGYGVVCAFAHSPQDADAQLIRRIRAIKRPHEWSVVTADRRVAGVARACGIRVISSRVFAAQLSPPASSCVPADGERIDVRLSEAEIAEWMRIFGEDPGADEAAPGDGSVAAPLEPPPQPAPARHGRQRRKR